jgi:hypothetical protein
VYELSPCPLVSEAFYRCLYGGVDDDRTEDLGLGRNVLMN